MLPNRKIVEEVYNSIIDNFKNNTLFVDCSTIDVDKSKSLHKKYNKHNLLSLDAPVSGGCCWSENETLTFMVGGSDETYNSMLPLFNVIDR